MTLKEFIEKVKAEENIPTDTDDIKNYVTGKARKQASRGVAVVDDDTVKNWILECREGIPKDSDVKTVNVEELKEKAVREAEERQEKRERPSTQKAKTWEMDSLF